jgi:hypothetical protein
VPKCRRPLPDDARPTSTEGTTATRFESRCVTIGEPVARRWRTLLQRRVFRPSTAEVYGTAIAPKVPVVRFAPPALK